MTTRARHFILTPLFAIAGRAGGIVIPFLIAYYYGAGSSSDAFFFAFALLFSLTGLFVPILESLLVPYLAEYREDAAKTSSLANGVLFFKLPVVLAVAALIAAGLVPFLTRASGFDPATAKLTWELYLVMLPLLIFGTAAAQSNGIFYTRKIFWFPAASPLIRSLLVILFLILFHQTAGIHAPAWGFAGGEILRWGIGMILVWKLAGWRPRINWQESREKMRSFMGHAGYHLLALLALNLIPLTDQWFASWLGAGNLSLLSYADRLFQVPFQLMMTGFLQIFLSFWSDHYYAESRSVFWQRVHHDIRIVFLVTLVLSVGLIVLRRPAVHLVFGWGNKLPQEELRALEVLFAWLMAGFAPAILNLLYVRVLFVLKKTPVFFYQSLIRLLLNIGLNAVFMRIWGLAGIAAATSLVFTLTTLWLYFYVRRKAIAEVSS